MDSLDVSLERLRDTLIPLRTRRVELSGEKIPFSNTSRIPRSTSREPKWFSLESRRRMSVETSLPTLRRPVLHKYSLTVVQTKHRKRIGVSLSDWSPIVFWFMLHWIFIKVANEFWNHFYFYCVSALCIYRFILILLIGQYAPYQLNCQSFWKIQKTGQR